MKAFGIAVSAALALLAAAPACAQTDYALSRSYTATPVITPASAWWLGENPPWVKFTDGISAWSWGDVTGWDGAGGDVSTTVTIDLGSVKTDIARVQVDQFVSISSAVGEASGGKVYGSTDGTNYALWADMTTTATVALNPEEMWYWVMENQGVKTARYVAVELTYVSTGWHKLLSEIWVLSTKAAVKDWELY